MADTQDLSSPKIDREINRLIKIADTFRIKFTEQEASALKTEAQSAVAELESADPARQKKGDAMLGAIKERLATKATDALSFDDEGAKTIHHYVDGIYENRMEAHAAGLAGTRIANGLIDTYTAATTGVEPAKALQNLSSVPLPESQLNNAAKEAVAKLNGFMQLDADANGRLSADELRKGGIAAKDGMNLDAKPLVEASIKLETLSRQDAVKPSELKENVAQAAALLTPAATPAGSLPARQR